jgi:myosin heavy subunit
LEIQYRQHSIDYERSVSLESNHEEESMPHNPLLEEEFAPEYVMHYAPTPLPSESVLGSTSSQYHGSAHSDFESISSPPLLSKEIPSQISSPHMNAFGTRSHLFGNPILQVSEDHQSEPSEEEDSRPSTPRIPVERAVLPESKSVLHKRNTEDQKSQVYSPMLHSSSISRPPSSQISQQEDTTSKSVSRIFDLLRNVEVSPMPTPKKPDIEMTADPKASVFEGIKSKIMQQQLEIENKSKMIESLKEEMKRQREMAKQELQQHQKSAKSQLNLQRKEYETIVKRHLGFIDKVLAEKEELTKKSLELTDQVKGLDKSYSEKIKSMEQDQARELKQQKEIWQTAEKVKRDKWIQEKTKSIKDQTVQSLEPEIQKLIAQHKVALRQAEESYRDQLAKEKAIMMEQHQRQIETLRDKHISERQKGCEEEREFARQRYIKQLERDEMEFQTQKRKMQSEFDEERHRLQDAANDHLKQVENGHKRTVQQFRKELEDERNQRDQMLEEQRKKHQQQLNQLHQQLQIEKEEWQANYMKKVEQQVRAREVHWY